MIINNDVRKYVVWLGDGGTTHMLCNLGACLRYAVRSGRLILPVTINQANLKDHFYRFYTLQRDSRLASYIVPPEQYCRVFYEYAPPHKELPNNLFDTKIDKEIVDPFGRIYYLLHGVPTVEGNVRYLDYPKDESPEYIVTWGGFDKYFSRQLYIVLETFSLHSSISANIFAIVRKTFKRYNCRRYISAHFRNTDYKSDINVLFQHIDARLRKLGDRHVFWATDDRASLELATKRYGSRIIPGSVSVDVSYFPEAGSLHSLKDQHFEGLPGVSRATLLADFFHDIYFMSKSVDHIGSSGNIGFLVSTLKKLPNLSCNRFFGFDSLIDD